MRQQWTLVPLANISCLLPMECSPLPFSYTYQIAFYGIAKINQMEQNQMYALLIDFQSIGKVFLFNTNGRFFHITSEKQSVFVFLECILSFMQLSEERQMKMAWKTSAAASASSSTLWCIIYCSHYIALCCTLTAIICDNRQQLHTHRDNERNQCATEWNTWTLPLQMNSCRARNTFTHMQNQMEPSEMHTTPTFP